MSFSEWREVKFQDITINLDNKRVPLSSRVRENRKGKYPYYGAQGIVDYIDDYIFDGEYLLIAEDGENLKSKKQNVANLAKGKFWVNNHAHVILNNDLSDLHFLYYIFNSIDIAGYITGSAQPKLSQQNLNKIKLVIPPLPEQKAIAATLSALDDMIELNNQINKILEEMAQALFKSWFVDFEPFRDGEFEESELGLIPKGWKVGNFGDIAYINTETINPQNYPETVFEHFSIPLFDEGKFSAFEKGELIKSNKYVIDSSCMLFSKLNPQFKRVFRPFCKTSKAICSTEFMVYKAIKPVYNSYIYSILCSDNFYQYVLQNVTGTTNSRQRAIPKSTLNFKIVIPDDIVLGNFAQIINGVFDIMQRIPEDNKLLASIRDVLLPKLMSGEIRVPIGN